MEQLRGSVRKFTLHLWVLNASLNLQHTHTQSSNIRIRNGIKPLFCYIQLIFLLYVLEKVKSSPAAEAASVALHGYSLVAPAGRSLQFAFAVCKSPEA